MSIVAIPAWRGEFGLKVCYHVPAVHAIRGQKVVFIERGEQALYPSAREHIEVDRREDAARRNSYKKDGAAVDEMAREIRRRYGAGARIMLPDATWPRKRFIPQPHVRLGITCDVVVCPRRRDYGSSKDWPHWPELTQQLVDAGLSVFAGGAPDSSYDVPCPVAWDFGRFLDATIEAMLSAQLVIATDAGLAHLAVLCGRPLLGITHADHRVAPGPFVDEVGKVSRPEYWQVYRHRYDGANHTGSPITWLPWAWHDPGLVLREAVARVRREEPAA